MVNYSQPILKASHVHPQFQAYLLHNQSLCFQVILKSLNNEPTLSYKNSNTMFANSPITNYHFHLQKLWLEIMIIFKSLAWIRREKKIQKKIPFQTIHEMQWEWDIHHVHTASKAMRYKWIGHHCPKTSWHQMGMTFHSHRSSPEFTIDKQNSTLRQ